MRKTSVYLPDALKRRLAARSEQAGTSEAQLIRRAVEAIVESTEPIETTPDPPVPGRLVGVGVGPGDPGLVTVAALAALRRADRVVAPCTSLDAVGRAELIVRQAAPDVAVERLRFVMVPDPQARQEALDEACATVAAHLDAGEEVAFITLGDPTIYSTVGSVVAGVTARRPETPWVVVPGVLAFQAVAAGGGLMLTDEQQSLAILAANTDLDQLDRELADPTRTVVIYKGGGRLPAIAERLGAAGRLDRAVLGELVGMPGGRVVPVAEVADRPATYLSSVIVPAGAHREPEHREPLTADANTENGHRARAPRQSP